MKKIMSVVAAGLMGVTSVFPARAEDAPYVIPPVTAIPGSGAVTAAELESLGIYVTDGLVAFYDGIQNDGDGRPHNSSAVKWTDRVRGATASFERAVDTRGPGAWAEDGYVFDGDFAYTDANISLPNTTFTGQVVTDVNPDAQVSRWRVLFSNNSDFGVYVDASQSPTPTTCRYIRFLADPYDGRNNNRPNFYNWEGQYVTFMFTPTQKMVFQGTEYANAIDRASPTATVNAMRWSIGGSPFSASNADGGRTTRYTLGKFHAARLYSRDLNEAELRRNREVDEIRYRGRPVVTNVVVAATLYGEGAEPAGAYTVRGSHTFTAPAHTSGSATFTATGYTLQNLKTDGTWSEPTEYSGTSYTHTVGDAQPTVKLTWKWNFTGGVLPVDSRLYAQDGLVFHFDGIDNAGFGRHDANATVWKNLAVEGLDAQFHRFNNDAASRWVDNGYWLSGKSYVRVVRDVDLGVEFTVQVACNVEPYENTSSYPHLFGTTGDGANVYTYSQGNELNFKFNDGKPSGNNNVKLGNWGGRSATYMYDGTIKYLSQTDARGVTLEHTGATNVGLGVRPWFIGAGGANDNQYRERLLVGVIHAVRVYNRVLTDAERTTNFGIDSARFRGGVMGDVTVASSHRDAAGTEPCGQYLLAEGGHTFTAPAGVTADGRTYALRGYRVETWDANGNNWTGASETAVADGAGASVTLTKGAAKQRLTWLWRVTRGLRAVGDLTLDDYVQDGLALHYDGLVNRGRQLPHATKTSRWLEARGVDNPLESSYKENAAAGWTANAYNFKDTQRMRMVNGIALGQAFTVELTVDCDVEAQPSTSTYPNFAGSYKDYGIYAHVRYDNGSFTSEAERRKLCWKQDDWAGSNCRPELLNWSGKYITAMFTPTMSYLFQGTALANGKARTSTANGFPKQRWGLASSVYDSTNPPDGNTTLEQALKIRYASGTYHAARFYNRALSEEELARNRSVDEVRFRGKTNVSGSVEVAVDPTFGLCGADAAGVYLVDGGWTFTAPERDIVIDNKTVTARPTGYWLETLNADTWGDRQFHSGAEYVHTASAAAAPVRLTWKYTHVRGTVLIVR